MKTKKALGAGLLIAGMSGLSASSLMADEWQYTYTGQNYNFYYDDFTGSEHVTVILDLDGALAPDLNYVGITTTDGITLSDGPASTGALPGETLSSEGISMAVTTDGSGNIIGWDITANFEGGFIGCYTFGDHVEEQAFANSNSAGTWTAVDISQPESATPEPGTVSMMLGGVLLCLGAVRRKSRAA